MIYDHYIPIYLYLYYTCAAISSPNTCSISLISGSLSSSWVTPSFNKFAGKGSFGAFDDGRFKGRLAGGTCLPNSFSEANK